MTEQQIAEAQHKARLAEQLLDNELLKETFEKLAEEYTLAFRNSGAGDKDEREVAYFRLKALDQFKQDLEAVAKGGRVSEFNNRTKLRLAQNFI